MSDPALAGVVFHERIGQGCRCVVFGGSRHGEQLALKVYRPEAVAKHARRFGGSIAQYEYERNLAYYGVWALAACVARPVGFYSSPGLEVFLQERIYGEPLLSFWKASAPDVRTRVLADIGAIVEAAHGAGLFDIDLQPSNIIVKRRVSAQPHPVFFDFNKVPYHVHPPNALMAAFVKLGLSTPESRDLRHLKTLHRICARLQTP